MATDNEESLRMRVADLEAVLRQSRNYHIVSAYHLSPQLTRIFGLLLSMPRVTTEMIEQRLEITSDTRVAIFRLRRAMKKHGIDIKSGRHVGYWLNDADKQTVLATLATFTVAPADPAAEGSAPAERAA